MAWASAYRVRLPEPVAASLARKIRQPFRLFFQSGGGIDTHCFKKSGHSRADSQISAQSSVGGAASGTCAAHVGLLRHRTSTGISPVLDVASVKTAASNQREIIDALQADAGSDQTNPTFYAVAQAGFNYVDDQCNAYFDEMFFLDRGRSQLKSGLAAASATTAAILGVTNASTLSMSIVASAFGFASNATDIVSGTYLYSLPPAATQGVVVKLQKAFRDESRRIPLKSIPARPRITQFSST